MNDLDICKRIAEIEGVKVESIEFSHVPLWRVECGRRFPYNPLTDDALWQQLIFKHEVSIDFITCNLIMIRQRVFQEDFTDIPSLKRNALLLIIEAHNQLYHNQ